jgi:hypothetical protein
VRCARFAASCYQRPNAVTSGSSMMRRPKSRPPLTAGDSGARRCSRLPPESGEQQLSELRVGVGKRQADPVVAEVIDREVLGEEDVAEDPEWPRGRRYVHRHDAEQTGRLLLHQYDGYSGELQPYDGCSGCSLRRLQVVLCGVAGVENACRVPRATVTRGVAGITAAGWPPTVSDARR